MPDTRYVEAQEHHRDLLDGLKPGDEVVITRNGEPVATLSPTFPPKPTPQQQAEAAEALLRMRALAKRINLDKETVREIIREGKPHR
ncbi:MAG TPA: hypothetical protein VED40_22930 [Azospirillaceae bacterium]|nr:hypothetical protein [Azospirillaceae bacterium]